MKLTIYQVDAFSTQLFSGNPAAVCPLESWLPDETMQNIAMENNLAETAFYTKKGNEFELRWMTPTVEVQLCGHATLASAHVLFQHEGFSDKEIKFHTKSGVLTVRQNGDLYEMNFPADFAKAVQAPQAIIDGLGIHPEETYLGKDDYMVILANQEMVENISPNFRKIASLTNCRGVLATAPGRDCDFVSRCFFPQSGVDEDPVTGSAHTLMTPYWAKRLGKNILHAQQLSRRKGNLQCTLEGERVKLMGAAKTYLQGEIDI